MPAEQGCTSSEVEGFEQSLDELERLVTLLEQGGLPLEESLKLFERGVQLTQRCQTALDKAEQRVRILTQDGKEEAFAPAPGEREQAP